MKRDVLRWLPILMLYGCGSLPDELPISDTREQELLFNQTRTLWTWNGNDVPVCWVSPGFATEKAIIRQAIEGTWGTQADLTFSGWAQCPTTGNDLLIRIETEDSRTPDAAGSADVGMEARRTPGAWSMRILLPIPYNPLLQSRIEYLAVHEMGHVLGFNHEQDSPANWAGTPPTPQFCSQTLGTAPGLLQISAYDQDSIMNYCGSHWNNSGALSAGDKKAIQQVYGPESESNVTAITSSSGVSHVFARGTNGALWWWSSQTGTWTSPFGLTQGTPTAISWPSSNGRVDLFARSTTGSLETWAFVANSWLGPVDLGGGFTEDVAAVSWGNGRIDLFGRGTDGRVYSKAFTSAVWTPSWVEMGGPIIGRVAAVSRGFNSIDLFVQGTDRSIYRKTWTGTAWSPSGPNWSRVHQNAFGEPFVAVSSSGLELFFRVARSGRLAHKHWHATTDQWAPNTLQTFWQLPSFASSDPAVFELNGRTNVFARGPQLDLQQATLLDPLRGIWSSWTSRGGILLSSPRAAANDQRVLVRGSNEAVHIFDLARWTTIGGQMPW